MIVLWRFFSIACILINSVAFYCLFIFYSEWTRSHISTQEKVFKIQEVAGSQPVCIHLLYYLIESLWDPATFIVSMCLVFIRTKQLTPSPQFWINYYNWNINLTLLLLLQPFNIYNRRIFGLSFGLLGQIIGDFRVLSSRPSPLPGE